MIYSRGYTSKGRTTKNLICSLLFMPFFYFAYYDGFDVWTVIYIGVHMSYLRSSVELSR